MDEKTVPGGTAVIHEAGSWTEFVVLRGLLRSEGIDSLAPNVADPYPMRQPPKGWQSLAIVVRESDAENARRIIAESLASGALPLPQDSSAESPADAGGADAGADAPEPPAE